MSEETARAELAVAVRHGQRFLKALERCDSHTQFRMGKAITRLRSVMNHEIGVAQEGFALFQKNGEEFPDSFPTNNIEFDEATRWGTITPKQYVFLMSRDMDCGPFNEY